MVHVGNMLAMCAMGMSEMLYLRSFMIGATLCSIGFNLVQPKPLFVPAGWGCLFVIGHGVQIALLLRESVEVTLGPEEHNFYEHAFLPYGFTPREFQRLLEEADCRWMDMPKGTMLCEQGGDVTHIWFLLSGKVSIMKDETVVNTIKPHSTVDARVGRTGWIGHFADSGVHESKADCHGVWDHSVRCKEPVRVVQINRDKMVQLCQSSDAMRRSSSRASLHDVLDKLQHSRQVSAKETYVCMVHTALVDEVITLREKRLLQEYRSVRKLKPALHSFALESAGWTEEQFDRGFRVDNECNRARVSCPAANGLPCEESSRQLEAGKIDDESNIYLTRIGTVTSAPAPSSSPTS
eukprot:TRINITY_DN8844_c0_g1_i2.p1 TRINITY_DN8844_c0_g1~~TRINITY_DN8844_c0_g1_i2.p1  ORF type:complete len:351 (+),score=44.65 TRINITY_DN8844_c0_g1_i2:236-1288(+)